MATAKASTVPQTPKASPDKDTAIYAELNMLAVSDEANALVKALLEIVETRELDSGSRTNGRAASKAKLRTAITSFLGDLLYADGHKKANGWVYRSMQSKTFTGEPVSVRTFKALVDSLKGLGYLEHVPGRKRWTRNAFDSAGAPHASGGLASHFRARPQLADLAAEFGVTGERVHVHFLAPLPERPIILKTATIDDWRFKVRGKKMGFERSTQVLELEAEIVKLNKFFDTFSIQGGSHRGYYRIFNEGDVMHPYRWNKGGRLYGLKGSYQNEKKDTRIAMQIGGSPVVEIDVNASYLTILHGIEGYDFDTSADPYDVGLERSAVKVWTVATLGHKRHHAKWPSKVSADYLKDHGCLIASVASIKHVKALMVAKHPLLMNWGSGSTNWADLMYAESKAMLGTMNDLMGQGKPSLSVHDSLIVRQQDLQAAREALGRNYQIVCGISPGLKEAYPVSSQ